MKNKIKKQTEQELDQKKRKLTWKLFWEQKLYELGIIPLGGLLIWKLPTLVGWGFLKLFNINPVDFTLTCQDTFIDTNKIVCDGINYHNGTIWVLGLLILIIVGFFITTNYYFASYRAEKKLNYWNKKFSYN